MAGLAREVVRGLRLWGGCCASIISVLSSWPCYMIFSPIMIECIRPAGTQLVSETRHRLRNGRCGGVSKRRAHDFNHGGEGCGVIVEGEKKMLLRNDICLVVI